MTDNLLSEDLDHILSHMEGLWEELRGQRIFITGGTGFIGCWLLESFAWANDRMKLRASAEVLSRNPAAFEKKARHLFRHPAIRFHQGDVRAFSFPVGRYSHIVHAAVDADEYLHRNRPMEEFEILIYGTKRVLDFARASHADKFLFLSSGAVYGKQPLDLSRIPEDYRGAPDSFDPSQRYGIPGEGKRAGEAWCALFAEQFGLQAKIARCFTFLGPYLPLDGKFAVGNFIRDGLKGGPIVIAGDGTPCRSYLYAADLAIWLWTILLKGISCRPYHVGSEVETDIRSLATEVADCFPGGLDVQIRTSSNPTKMRDRYIPSTARASEELHLRQTIPLRDAILRTIAWHRRRSYE
jgi:dTDP-glucose 4,6-dehydratase